MERIELKVGKTVFLVPEFNLMGWNTVAEWSATNRNEINEAIADSLEKAIPAGIDKAPVLSVKETGIVLHLDRDSYRESLDRCIAHYLDLENCERCSRLQGLRERI